MTEDRLPEPDPRDPGHPPGRTSHPWSPKAPPGPRHRVARRSAVTAAAAAATTAAALGLVAGLVVVSSAGGHRHPSLTGVGGGPSPTSSPWAPGVALTGSLVSFDACNAYLDYMRTTAESLVGPYGLQPYPGYGLGLPYPRTSLGPAVGLPTGSSGVASATAGGAVAPAGEKSSAAASSATAMPAGGATAAPASGGEPTFSQTNDQVAGVDEPDTVKTDGQTVVTLVGSTLRVLDPSARVLGSIQLSGDTGGGLLVDGTLAVVLSSGGTSRGPVGVEMPAVSYPTVAPATAPGAQVSVVDLSVPSAPRLVRTFHFDGTLVAARGAGGRVRLVLRSDGPRLNFSDPSTNADQATAANRQLIASSNLDDWLPSYQVEDPNGATTARQPISSCTSVARPATAAGISTVSIVSLDPAATTPEPGVSVVAAGDTVYATAAHVYVAGPTGTNPYAGAQPSGCCSVIPPRQASTDIYTIATPPTGPPSYEGEGTVPGWLINSYAMDETAAGLLRVASTSQTPDGSTQSQITVLQPTGNQLVTLGAVGNLGSGEFIRAVRFIGDQAYVVTYRTFDPLYVVNLTDPNHPVLAGELDQPGFSEFLYPLPAGRLLGVGVQITDGEPSGLVVATYDVSDPAHPSRISESTLATGYQYVAGGYDPHAFLYWAPAGLALLAVDSTPPVYPGGPMLYPIQTGGSGLAAYRIAGDGTLGRVATLAHDQLPASRSIVIANQVWALTPAGVITAGLPDLGSSAWHSY